MSVIDEVKQRADIVESIGQYVALTKAGRNFRGLCPFHGEKNPSFFVYPEQQSWHCFGCNSGGDVFSFVMKKEDIGFGDTLRLIAERVGVPIPSGFERDNKKEEKEELHQINATAAQYFHDMLLNSPSGEKARSYVDKRSFSAKSIIDFQLGFSPDSWESLKQYLLERDYAENKLVEAGLIIAGDDGKTHDRFRGRLMFPIRDDRGRTIGFGARALDDSMPKYLNSPQTPVFDKSGNLYALDLAAKAIKQQDMAVIVEGYIDVITAHQNSITNVVASMGTAITEKQVGKLKKLTKNLVLALDADAAGEEAMLRGVSHENTLDAEIRVILLPESKDPDDVIREDVKTWQLLVEKSMPIIDYTFNAVTSGLDLTTAKGEALAVERLLPTVAEIKNPVRRSHYIQKLARLVRKNERTIEATLSRMMPRAGRHKTREPQNETVARAIRPLMSDPLEEYCLALLLQHPELKDSPEELLPEYFEHSENREIFSTMLQTNGFAPLKDKLDPSIHGYLDSLLNKNLPSTNVEQRHASYALGLRERFLKGLEAKRAEVFAQEAETEGFGADLARRQEEGIDLDLAIQLKNIYTQKSQRRS